MRPDTKIDRYKISNRFEFRFCLHDHIGAAENSCMENQLLLTGTLNTLQPEVSCASFL